MCFSSAFLESEMSPRASAAGLTSCNLFAVADLGVIPWQTQQTMLVSQGVSRRMATAHFSRKVAAGQK